MQKEMESEEEKTQPQDKGEDPFVFKFNQARTAANEELEKLVEAKIIPYPRITEQDSKDILDKMEQAALYTVGIDPATESIQLTVATDGLAIAVWTVKCTAFKGIPWYDKLCEWEKQTEKELKEAGRGALHKRATQAHLAHITALAGMITAIWNCAHPSIKAEMYDFSRGLAVRIHFPPQQQQQQQPEKK